jgi:hypothetical protein
MVNFRFVFLIHLVVGHKLLICNTLDVMHYENNLCENVMKTIFRTNDIPVVQEDFKKCGI